MTETVQLVEATEGILPPGTNTKPRRKRRKKKKKKRSGGNQSSCGTIDNDDDSSVDDGFGRSNDAGNRNRNRNESTVSGSLLDTAASNMSTPQVLLRHRLIETDGYEAARVDLAMEEMWEKGLPYDEYGAVVDYLKGGGTQTFSSTTVAPTLVSVANTHSKEEVGTQTTEPAPSSTDGLASISDGENEAAEDTELGDLNNVGPSGIGSGDSHDLEPTYNDSMDDNDQDSKEEEEASSASVAPMSRAEILNHVVSKPHKLTDSLYAITKWVKKTSNIEDIEDLCIAEKNSALSTVIFRGLSSEIEDSQEFETKILPALKELLMSVLDRCGVVEELGKEDLEQLYINSESLMKMTRKVCLVGEDENNKHGTGDGEQWKPDIAGVSRFIVSCIQKAMEETKQINKARNDKLQKHVICEDRVESTSVGIFKHRDETKASAKIALASVKSILGESFNELTENQNQSSTIENGISNGEMNGDGTPYQDSSNSTPTLNQDLVLVIVDETTKNRFDDQKARLEALKAKVRPGVESSEAVRTLRETVTELKASRLTYKQKVAQLRAEIEELEARDEEAASRIEGLTTQIEEEEVNDDLQAKQLEQDIQEAKESVRYGNLVNGLAGMMRHYGKSLEEATSCELEKEEEEETPLDASVVANSTIETSASEAMEDYLSKIRHYFLAEAECKAQLQLRLAEKTSELTSLRTELSQYTQAKGLGKMTSIIAQLQQSISENERAIKQDTSSLETLDRDGLTMYQELLSRLEAYNQKVGIDEKKDESNGEIFLNLFPSTSLRGVPAAIRSLQIVDNCDRLEEFVDETAASSEDTIGEPDAIETNDSTSDTVPSLPKAIPSTPASSTPPRAPKMTWATAKPAMPSASEKPSLLDIQKEQQEKQL
eukprot:CAMPEP_0172380818 /NCGR_PEP_ID=MMETSP1060-20121228/70632_1 /TAXON_ID=37318 /ORGANISM="Pseudo-nitzschia pungens, Strain cf. cingulata" /LENGTH=886 /DNA_ID=CAMNT_0013108581 /DNA_START=182 /DNA_END=2842 /DNA_ORIENTATION=+